MEKIRSTDEGKLNNQNSAREGMEKIRSTDEGQEKNRDYFRAYCAFPDNKVKNEERAREGISKKRAERSTKFNEKISNMKFPPDFHDDEKIEEHCINNFLKATSVNALETRECGVCGIAVGKGQFKIRSIDYDITDNDDDNEGEIPCLPNIRVLSTEHQEDPNNCLEEYVFEIFLDGLNDPSTKILLSPGGVNEIDKEVVCCNKCLFSLKNDQLPIFSIANNFQIGSTPPELSDLTLPEKLLIAKARPEMYVVKLRGTGGPHVQRGLKGNTITFPQDVVKMARTLPANPDILADHIRVIFIGKNRPTANMLKKILTVRRHKIYAALEFLCENHPCYADVIINNRILNDLPVDNVPRQVLQTLEMHEDPDDKDADEHSTYTPQTDLDDIPPDTVIMNSVGLVDFQGTTVNANDQMLSAVQNLTPNDCRRPIDETTASGNMQGTIILPRGSIPINEYNNPNLWYMSYPWLFPYGRGGPEIQRKRELKGIRGYGKHVLQLADRKFSLDESFKFHLFNVIQKRDVSYHTSLHVRKPGFDATARSIDTLNTESMEQVLKSIEQKKPITDPNLKKLMDSLSSAGRNINGSPYQKSTYRRQIFGLMIELGTPVLWITLSPAVTHSPIFMRIAGVEVDMSEIPSHAERAQMVANDPVAAAIYFNTVIDAFTEHILGYKKEEGGIFGHVSGYYGMVEEQGTGTLHNHMLVWLHGFNMSELKSQLEDDESFKKSLTDYLDRIIKQGYLDTDGTNDINESQNDNEAYNNLNVSEVSFKEPVDPKEFENDEAQFRIELNDDVNKVVTVANIHKCRFTCYKYSKKRKENQDDCRFEYPRELVAQSTIEDNQVKLKRTHPMINNFNPTIMNCTRSNHDIKFIPSGKDGKNIAFYVTNYATKSQLSTHNMVPLIALSRKRLDQDESIALSNVNSRAKAMITKCLNRITTETEISGSHVSHFLLRNLDNKTSHTFIPLNLHSVFGWLFNANREYDNIAESLNEIDEGPNDNNSRNPDVNDNNDNNSDDDDDDDDDDENTGESSYSISTGNKGLVFVNQMTDYLHRGDTLKHMCLWEYAKKICKYKLSKEESKKFDETNEIPQKKNTDTFTMHKYDENHPQSETHWQKERINGSFPVPFLSTLPPSKESNKLKFQKCMLLLFKPFATFEELYNGISWNETYTEFWEVTDKKQYILNIEELHKGIDDKEENDENDDDLIDEIEDDCGDDPDQSNINDEPGLDSETVEAIKVIETTPWLKESISNNQNEDDLQSVLENSTHLPSFKTWEADMSQQNQDKLDNPESEPNDDQNPGDFITTNGNCNVEVTFSMIEQPTAADIENERNRINVIREDISRQYTLNRKQKIAFEMATENVMKRHLKEKNIEQLKAYVGGPGGTGKSQIIKAIVEFHDRMKVKRTLKLSAMTGTASKHIGGSTTTTMFGGFDMNNLKQDDKIKLQYRFRNVETIIIDEVSMIGCRHLANISRALSHGKNSDPQNAFGGVDMIFFGDFIQFPPVKDSPLYAGWDKTWKRPSKSEENKQIGILLWKQVDKIILLDQQMRCTDPIYLDILNRLREGKCTDDDIALLNTRVVGTHVDITSILDVPIITPGNKLVMAINDLFTGKHSQRRKVYISTAQDYKGRKNKRKQIPKKVAKLVKNWPATATEGLPRELQLYVGMPVIVTRNLHTELGVTNGTTGWIKSIHFSDGKVVSGTDTGFHHIQHPPEYIIVELEDVHMKPLEGLPPNHVPIFQQTRSIGVRLRGRKNKVNFNRRHFPLVPRFSCTAHKSQGQTLSKAIADLEPNSKCKKKPGVEFAYVPLSRVRTLNDLTLLRPILESVLKAKVNEACAAMMAEFKDRDLCKDM